MRQKWWTILAALLLFCCAPAFGQEVRVGVLGIFRPQQLTLSPLADQSMIITGDGKMLFLPAGADSRIVHIKISADLVVVEFGGKVVRSKEIHAANSNSETANFILAIPGKIKRQYRGLLDVKLADGALVPVVTMELESAVASVVQAEADTDTPAEALKAQAVVTRSYFVAAGGRHANFDFCDLTHCPFLREPARPESPAALAAAATRGLILTFEEKPVAAMFTRSCGGETRTPASIGMSAAGYPYFPVRCDACYTNPVRWTRRVSAEDAAILFARGEAGRLTVDRRLGWSAVPSNNFTARKVDDEVLLYGQGEGHGIGLCQRGSRDMAANGADFNKILLHYFPNTMVASVEGAKAGSK